MPYCPKCGKEVLEDTTYCPHCGSHIHALAPVLKLREKKLPFKVKGSPFKAIFLKEILPILILVVVAAVFITHPQWFSVPFLTTDTAANHLNQGVALYEAGEYEKAVAEYTKAIELDPKLASAYYNRGLAYFKMRQYDSALADFNKAIELDPRSSTAWVGRGIALEGLGKYKEALEAYNKSLEINPNDQRAKSNKDRLLAYLASLPITYNRGQFGLKTTTTQTLGSFKIERTATCTTYGYPFDLKLYRGVLGGQAIYIGSAETTLHYEGDWSVAVIGSEEGQKTEVLTPSGHISGNVKVAIMGVWKDGRLGLMISPAAELPAEGLTISVKVRTSWFDQEGKLIFTHTGDLPLIQHLFMTLHGALSMPPLTPVRI